MCKSDIMARCKPLYRVLIYYQIHTHIYIYIYIYIYICYKQKYRDELQCLVKLNEGCSMYMLYKNNCNLGYLNRNNHRFINILLTICCTYIHVV